MTHYITTLLEDANNLTQSLGLEVDGVFVTDPTKSVCGRFDLNKDQSLAQYDITSERYDQMVIRSQIEWTDHSYANDACPSIGFDLDNTGENYVQLFAFETKEDADREGLDVYGITVCVNGDTTFDDWSGNDRSEGLSEALKQAIAIQQKHAKNS